jgi:hypothetical protein
VGKASTLSEAVAKADKEKQINKSGNPSGLTESLHFLFILSGKGWLSTKGGLQSIVHGRRQDYGIAVHFLAVTCRPPAVD